MAYTPYLFLLLALLSLWITRKVAIWGTLLLAGIITGLWMGRLGWMAIPSILVFGALCYFTFKESLSLSLRILCAIAVMLLSIGLGLHYLPGFNNLKVFTEVFSPGAYPYTQYLNFDKPLVGLFILGFGWRFINQKAWSLKSVLITMGIMLLTLSVLMPASLGLHYVNVDPKFPHLFWIWAAANLFFGCIAEEALFRGLIQNALTRTFSFALGSYLAILITAILFGLLHFGGGIKFILLAALAGVFYGLAYQKTQRIEASIITHFTLNASHFLLFTYPALKPV